MSTKLQKLQEMMNLVNEGITRDEFMTAFKEVVRIVQDVKDTNVSERKFIHQTLKEIPKLMTSEVYTSMSKTEKKMVKDCMSMCKDMCSDMDKRHKSDLAKMDSGMKKLEDSILSKEDIIAFIPKQKEDTGDDLVGKINRAESKISRGAIEGLEEEIKALRKELATKASSGARRVFQPYLDRFKDDCNGSNKVFYLSREPLRTDTIEVSGTDFPIILDPTVDFTVAGKVLTLTSAVPAPNTGATLICKYYA